MRLDSVRILDLTRLLPGPYATQLLADAGADVVNVEDTDAGDYARDMPPTTERGVGALFDGVNRGKRSVALNLKRDEGKRAFYRLVESADVVVEGFRPGVAERLGIDYETLTEYNADLVYCSLTGYGQTGPDAERAGHDLNYVGVAGLLDMTREDKTSAPQMPGYQIGDLGGGLFAAFSIVGGLLSRELGHGGEYVDVAMTDVVASFGQAIAHRALTGDDPRPGETELTGKYPWYDIYETADGRYVTLAALEPKFWRAFCEEVDREDLIDAHGSDDPAELEALREELTDLFATRSRDAWLDALSDETTVGPVCTPAETVEHPQIEARGLVERHDDAPPRIGFPAEGSNIPEPRDESVPAHGEHTDELLVSVGYDEDEVAALREADVVR
ncbi:CaiB/BaiF CoA transferase family protein [Natrinema salifodinae]|uniref:Crotonobetainyl-CoA:carnitine CoA-transferase CaiB n=1 Tax=Natrinema salifodinae TaxID=1202768 RepID=A0A1I0Q8I4_9EURY|nr:CaiB/BaiF CoA-transferase family protein [Natrinema salifodinae]SEW23330.1 Crotonobetainyl-CoA:carnitine CoA-transferase CaiB [Natrinema salifodinae]